MKYRNNMKENLNFDQIFVNVHFSITIAHTNFKFCLLMPHIRSEGSVSQIIFLGLSFYSVSKNGKHFLKFVSIIFEVV